MIFGGLLGIATLAGCGCPSFATLNVQDPDGVADPTQIDIVSEAAAAFVEWTGRDGVCVDTIELTNSADAVYEDAVGAYYGPGEPIRVEVGTDSWLPGIVWHELGHALDDVEQIALSHGNAFPTQAVNDHYSGAEVRIDEAFAEACEEGPPPFALLYALEQACGEMDLRDQAMQDLVFRRYSEPSGIGVDDSAHWEPLATLSADIYDVQPFADADGTVGIIGASYIAEGYGYRYSFHRMALSTTDTGLPSLVEDGVVDYSTFAGDARFVPSLDGQIVVQLVADSGELSLVTPDFATGAWDPLDLPGIVRVLGDAGVVSFEGGNVWWEDYGDGFGLQGSTLSGESLPIGQFDDGEARPPYAYSAAGGLYSMVRDTQFDEYAVQRWDDAWSEPDLPRGFFPQGGSAAGDEIAYAGRLGFRTTTQATLYKPAGGEWSIASRTCGGWMEPLLVGGQWYGLDRSGTGLYRWVP